MTIETPDDFTPLVGWRAWSRVDLEYRLQPLAYTALTESWPHKRPAQCVCGHCGSTAAPNRTNGLGYYAFRKVLDLYKEVPNAAVYGQIYIWGRIVACGEQHSDQIKGWRAQFAYPKSLMVYDEGLVEPLSKAYGVPVEHGNFKAAMDEMIRSSTNASREDLQRLQRGY